MKMEERIEEARKEAEAHIRAKDEKRKELAKDMSLQEYVKSVLEDEDLQEMSRLSEMFEGKFIDISKAQKYEKVNQLAQWLYANCSFVHDYCLNEIRSDERNAGVRIDLSKIALFQEKDLQIFAHMCLLADDIVISGLRKDTMSISFGIENVNSDSTMENDELERMMLEDEDYHTDLEGLFNDMLKKSTSNITML